MPRITSGRLALATSSLALAVAIGGTGYAAVKIGTNQIKNNAVTTQKIKNNNVTGQDVKESSLAKVPSAGKADSATNAGKVGGLTVAKVRYQSNTNAPTVVVNIGGLVITALCSANDLSLLATTTKEDSNFYSALIDLESDTLNTIDFESGDFDTADSADLLGAATSDEEDPGILHFAFDAQDGSVVTGILSTDNDAGPGNNGCNVSGTVTGG